MHVCGEQRAADLVKKLCAMTGDSCVVHKYKRLSPLVVAERSLNNSFRGLRPGDAVVSFSRVSLHKIKQTIQTQTGRQCAIIYGALPPEVRSQQAALFNDPNSGYDILVASDAMAWVSTSTSRGWFLTRPTSTMAMVSGR